MKKSFRRWIVTALAPALAWAALAGLSANAQQQNAGIASGAQIYGYDLSAGNWTLDLVRCPVMANVSLLHYRETFPDGTESRFTAVVPSAGGHVHIVPVLYRNATPFLPAPRNPRNYALFNQLVQGSAAKGTWLDLSACYAALTGAGSGVHSKVGIAGAPKPTVHLDPAGKTHRVTFATREGQAGYMVWNVSFDRFGRVTTATTEDESVYTASADTIAPPTRKHRENAANAKPAHKVHRKWEDRAVIAEPAPQVNPEPQEQDVNAESAPEANREAQDQPEVTPPVPPVVSQRSKDKQPQQPSSDEAGWKFIPQAPDPPSKIIPEPRQPSEAVLPN
jgi:hypothetical protein